MMEGWKGYGPFTAETLLQDVSAKLEELTEKLPDCQAIPIKLAKQINKVVKSILKTLSEVNGYLPNDVP